MELLFEITVKIIAREYNYDSEQEREDRIPIMVTDGWDFKNKGSNWARFEIEEIL